MTWRAAAHPDGWWWWVDGQLWLCSYMSCFLEDGVSIERLERYRLQ